MNKLPEFFVKKLEQQYGKENAKKIEEGYTKKRLTTFRVNTLKSNCEEIEKNLKLESNKDT